MIAVTLRHKTSRRRLGHTAFHLRDRLAEVSVAKGVMAVLECQQVDPRFAEVRIGSQKWQPVKRADIPQPERTKANG